MSEYIHSKRMNQVIEAAYRVAPVVGPVMMRRLPSDKTAMVQVTPEWHESVPDTLGLNDNDD